MKQLIVFVDSDVVISSLISQKGAAHLLLAQTSGVGYTISNYSIKELKIVCKRLKINQSKLDRLIKTRLKTIVLTQKPRAERYVFDSNDAHVVTGAIKSKARFLVTYNLKHFKTASIKNNLGIIATTPANFLQYLRSIGYF